MRKDLFVPKFTSNDESVKIVEWLVKDRDYVESGQRILVIETSKTNVEIECEASGYIFTRCQPDDTIMVGKCYANLFASVDDLQKYQSEQQNNISEARDNFTETSPKFSNAALKYLEEHQLNPLDFTDLKLVTVEKIKEKLEKDNKLIFQLNNNDFPNKTVESLSFAKLSEINSLTKGRDAVISSLTVQFNSEIIRKKFMSIPWLNRRILPYILYIFSRLLVEYPRFTSFYLNEKITLYNRVNLGIAIDLGKGLKVVVIKDANILSLFDLQMSIIDSIAAYHENSLDLATLQNSTVTVTDLSQDNILHFQPVLKSDQAIILGIGGDQDMPGSPMSLTIVFDHRVLSGQEVATFLKHFKERLLTEYVTMDLN